MLITRLRFQGNAWADIPAEVIEQVLDKLSTKDRWNSRLISSSWGLVVRGSKCSVVIPVNASTLWTRATSFRQRQKQYPRTRFTLRLAKSLGFAACAVVLAAIAVQARNMTLRPVTPAVCSLQLPITLCSLQGDTVSNCDLEVTLAVTQKLEPSNVVQICNDVKAIAAAANTLQKQDVLVRIRLQSALPHELNFMLVKQLGHLLYSIDCHQVTDLSAGLHQVSDFTTKPAASFSLAALQHLGNSNSPIQSLCLSDHSLLNMEPCRGLSLENGISAIASVRHLTKLHLSIQARTDFHPLTQLTNLEDLALQSDSRSASACDVLHSSKHSLQRVVLSSRGWDTATFEALHDLPKLDTVTVKVLLLTDGNAMTLGSLLRPSSVQLMLRKCSKMQPQTLHTLTSGIARITHLELWELDQACYCQLQPLQFLSGLTLVWAYPEVTGQGFKSQTQLDTLRLVSCPGLSDEGLQQIIMAAPALRKLMINQASELNIQLPNSRELQRAHHYQAELTDTNKLTKHGLISLVKASQLMYVDLQGVKITKGGAKLLESSIYAQQKAGRMPSAVALVLAKFPERYGECLNTLNSIQYPSFVLCSEGRSNIIHCGSVNRNAELKEVLANYQILSVNRR